jgi:hypothetical protein
MRRLTLLLALALVVGSQGAARSQSLGKAWTGTRHLVLSKSTFRGDTPPRERTFIIEPTDGGFKGTVTGIEADGTPMHFSYAARLDGKYYPVSGTRPSDSTSFRRVTARRLESTRKVDDRVEATSTFALSPDGRVVTLTFMLPGGKPGSILVFEK